MIAGAKTISFNPNSNLFMIISNNHINGKNDPIFVSEQEFLSKNVKIFDLLRTTNNFKYLFFFALVPFIVFLVFLKNSDNIKDKIADIDTNKLVIISEFLSPICFPKKPDVMAASKGRNNNAISMLPFQAIDLFNSDC